MLRQEIEYMSKPAVVNSRYAFGIYRKASPINRNRCRTVETSRLQAEWEHKQHEEMLRAEEERREEESKTNGHKGTVADCID